MKIGTTRRLSTTLDPTFYFFCLDAALDQHTVPLPLFTDEPSGLRFSWKRVFVIDLELRTLPHGLIGVTSLSRSSLSFPQSFSYVHASAPAAPRNTFIQPLKQPEPEPMRSVAAKHSPDMGPISRQRSVTNVTNRRTGNINTVGDMSIN